MSNTTESATRPSTSVNAACMPAWSAMAAKANGAPTRWDAATAGVASASCSRSFQVFDALRVDTLGDVFDTVVDSGLFHVFDDAARARYIAAVHAVLRPGGHLHLMCFSDRQPGDWGPRRVTEGELRAALGDCWRIASLATDRFDINPGLGTPAAKAWLADAVRLAPA